MNRKEALRQYNIRQLKKDVKTTAEGAVINTMNNFDPTAKQAEEAQQQQAENLQESAAQDKAMEVDSEEGTTEG
jgi:hypothetical protein